MRRYHYLILMYSLVCVATCKNLPDFVNKCKWNSSKEELGQCLANEAQKLLPMLSSKEGIPGLNMPSVEPLVIDRVEVETAPGQKGNIQLILDSIQIRGGSRARIDKFLVDVKENVLELQITVPKLDASAQYAAKGKFLLYPIDSKGKGALVIEDARANVTLKGQVIKKDDGKEYIKLADHPQIIDKSYKNGGIELENIISGDSALSGIVNEALNANFDSLAMHLNPTIDRVVDTLITKVIQPAFDGFSVDELFEV